MERKQGFNSRVVVMTGIALVAMALITSSCGRRGDLDAPGAKPMPANAQKTDETAKPVVEDKPFYLDPLL